MVRYKLTLGHIRDMFPFFFFAYLCSAVDGTRGTCWRSVCLGIVAPDAERVGGNTTKSSNVDLLPNP